VKVAWLFSPDILVFLAGGLAVTLALAVSSIAISFVLGIGLALARLSRAAWLRLPAIGYIEGMRALPVFLIILFAYLALPKVLGFRLSPYVAGVVALASFTAALVAEIVRAGILAVPRGIVEAAVAQGFSPFQRLQLVVMPIALRQMTPALTAQFVTLLKDTSLTAVIGNLELLRRAQILNSQPPFQPIPTYALVALTYFAVNYALSRLSRRFETRTLRV
jgi:His/Glu/Gln/Arg/opine family amino acid ABC transporter permease subunit